MKIHSIKILNLWVLTLIFLSTFIGGCKEEAAFSAKDLNNPLCAILVQKVSSNQYIFSSNSLAKSYYWNFGDGETSTSASPTHTYRNSGTYTIKLSIITSSGTCESSIQRTIEKPAFTPTSMVVKRIYVTQFPGTNNGSSWDFGNNPDIKLKFGTSSSEGQYFVGDYYKDASSSNVPYSWLVNQTLSVSNFSSTRYSLTLYDYDTPDPDDYMGGAEFSLSSYITSMPTTIPITYSGAKVEFELEVEWK